MMERFFIEQGIRKVELDAYLRKQLKKAGFTKAEIVKTPLVTRIVVNVTTPGLAIGKGGQNIRQLTDTIKEKFKIDNPQLEIKEIDKPNLDAQVVADRIASLISTGYSWRSIVYKIVKDIMNDGAQGVEINLSGVLAGKGQRKRKQRIFAGYMKKVGEQVRLVDSAKANAYSKIGAIGVKVRIVKPGVKFPDKVNLQAIIDEKKKPKEEAAIGVEATETIEKPKEEKKEEIVKEKAGEKKEEKKSEKHAEKKELKKEHTGEKKAEKKKNEKEAAKKEHGEKKHEKEKRAGKDKRAEKKN